MNDESNQVRPKPPATIGSAAAHPPARPSQPRVTPPKVSREDPGLSLASVSKLRKVIDQVFQSRTAPPGTKLGQAEEAIKRRGERVWLGLKKHPSLGVILASGLGLAAAELVGVGEIVFGAALGYAAYLVLGKGMPIAEALKESERLVRD